MIEPTGAQLEVTRRVVAWYVRMYYGTPDDLGMATTFTDAGRVGHFAVEAAQIEAGEPVALFKLLITVAMFQRLRDATVLQILRGISAADVHELTSLSVLRGLTAACACVFGQTNEGIKKGCDLTKDSGSKGTCGVAPALPCHLKRHTELLRRYGHFGKVPSSMALGLTEAGFDNLGVLYERVRANGASPDCRAIALEGALCEGWRVGDKLSAMFLSLVAAPGMGFARAPWQAGVAWERYVVVDRNVDLFLASIGYAGPGTYEARRGFVQALARGVDFSALVPGLPAWHPRLVQQALYMFMSRSNRRLAGRDCGRQVPVACGKCPSELVARCPVGPGA